MNGKITKTKPGRGFIAFGWYGGKFSHKDWILPLLPSTQHFCEPFGGSAAILLNKDPSPVETYNDIDGEVVNFFRILRENRDELLYAIGMTPFSREEFQQALSYRKESISDLERARRFFVRARQVRTGLAQTASNGRWANCLKTSRAGMAGSVSRWLGSVEALEFIATRLLRVQIENDYAHSVIKRYDSEDTLFYCDPPYPHDSRNDLKAYQFEMSNEEHEKLAYVLNRVKGKVAISSYDSPLMEELYKGWNKFKAETKKALSVKKERTEVLWTNYDINNERKEGFFREV
ncbi:MAG: DNA methyltransferase [Bacteroidetes bacterium SW_11_45_7]|nr:MAG: DNA methyltransferase [Bacteroidetes bacterium SW_11_45_7]